jgi:lysophospholipase L1-like esterase
LNLYAHSLILSAVLAIAACGGGSGNSPVPNQPADPISPPGGQPNPDPTPPPPDPVPPNTSPYVIDYYGDSTVWGWASGSGQPPVRVDIPAPLAFANRLPSSPQNLVRNEGVNGTTACGLLEGDGVHPPWPEQMQASSATHVIINHGINDRKVNDVTRYRTCLTALSTVARANGKQVVFETPNPISAEGLAVYVDAMRSVAAAQQPPVPVINQYQFLTNHLDGRSVIEIVPDGEHPSQAVYIMKGEYAADVFMSLFPR